MAKIILLQKPDQWSYTIPGTYRPILLLPTLNKALESIVAKRIRYLATQHSILPSNHFRGLKRKSTIDALVPLQEEIYQVWQDKKILSFVTFDIKGAFNGIAHEILAL